MNLAGAIALPVVAALVGGWAVRDATGSMWLAATAGVVVAVGGWTWLGHLWLASLTGKPW